MTVIWARAASRTEGSSTVVASRPAPASTPATSLPYSRNLAQARRVIPPVALGMPRRPSGLADPMRAVHSERSNGCCGARDQIYGAQSQDAAAPFSYNAPPPGEAKFSVID